MSHYAYDTTVQCRKCGRKQHLDFVNGLKNGWSKCCGETMPIIHCRADIDKAMKEALGSAIPEDLRMTIVPKKKKKQWSVS